MFLGDIFEKAERRLVVIYPGRFQPFHLGHAEVFATLQAKFGAGNVFIGTSNKVDTKTGKSPFSFSDKVTLMHAAGIANDRIVEANEMYRPEDYRQALNLDLSNTVMIFAVGAPDAERLQVDSVYTEFTPTGRKSTIPPGKQVGDAKPYKSFKSFADSVTADQHQYVVIVSERKKAVTIKGQQYDASHGTECRNLWNVVRHDPEAIKEFLTQLYGRATPEIVNIFNKIPDTSAPPVATEPPRAPKLPKTVKAAGLKEEAAAVGLVKNGKDPRYYTATMGDQNDVDANTLGKEMKAYHLTGVKYPKTRQKPVNTHIGKGINENAVLRTDPTTGEKLIAPSGGMGSFSPETLLSTLLQQLQDVEQRVAAGNASAGEYLLYKNGVIKSKIEALARYQEFMQKLGKRPIAKGREVDLGENT